MWNRSWKKKKEGAVFVVSAPSGAGKTTIMRRVLRDPELRLKYSISFTTREPRKGEKDKKDYFFVSRGAFLKKVKKGDFLEHAQVFGHYYGTDKGVVSRLQKSGLNVLIDVDTKGASLLRRSRGLKAVYIFILPPSRHELRERLIRRQREKGPELRRRLQEAARELRAARSYDYCIVNEDISRAVQDMKAILRAELLKSSFYEFASL